MELKWKSRGKLAAEAQKAQHRAREPFWRSREHILVRMRGGFYLSEWEKPDRPSIVNLEAQTVVMLVFTLVEELNIQPCKYFAAIVASPLVMG